LGPMDAAVVECSPRDNDPGMALARRIREQNPHACIVFIASESSEELAVEALRIGAIEYLKPPVDLGRLTKALNGLQGSTPVAAPPFDSRSGRALIAGAIVGESSRIQQVKNFLPKVAASGSNVLI